MCLYSMKAQQIWALGLRTFLARFACELLSRLVTSSLKAIFVHGQCLASSLASPSFRNRAVALTAWDQVLICHPDYV